MHIVYPAVVSALLFSIGVYGVLARRNTILVLMSVELMLNAVNLNLVAFDVWLRDRLHGGQVLTLFVIVIAAAEVGIGLAIVLAVYRTRRTVDLDSLTTLTDPPGYPTTEEADDPQGPTPTPQAARKPPPTDAPSQTGQAPPQRGGSEALTERDGGDAPNPGDPGEATIQGGADGTTIHGGGATGTRGASRSGRPTP